MKNSTPPLLAFLLILFISTLLLTSHSLRDTINQNEIIKDGETLVSVSGIFVLGFFNGITNGSSTKSTRYLGIWYNFSTDAVVWVANREDPVTKSFGALQLNGDGDLIISQSQTSTINTNDVVDVVWSSNSSNPTGNTNIMNPVAKLSDSGNLIITNGADGGLIWQSFDYPSDTFLPGMKIGFDKRTNQEWYLTSWRQPRDPSPGDVMYKMDTSGSKQIYFIANNQKLLRFGPWNGEWLNGRPGMVTNDEKYTYVHNQMTTFYKYEIVNEGTYIRVKIFSNKTSARMIWRSGASKWISYNTEDVCDSYSKCGPNGVCKYQGPNYCNCYDGFRPKSNASWLDRDYTLGCERNEKVNCSVGEGFLRVKNLKIPDTTNSTIDKNMSLDDCRVGCTKNCSCVAYAPLYLGAFIPRGCIMWFGDLIDTKLSNPDGQDLYLRSPSSVLPNANDSSEKKKTAIIAAVVPGVLIILSLFGVFIWIKEKKKKRKRLQRDGIMEASSTSYGDNIKWKDEVNFFDISVISSATNNFYNKIGQGGFGSVYKGTMPDGMEIAVKRLSRGSGQGLDEFMNEVVLISKLQHKNLVRLLGCCMEGDERILVFEFMKNKSLDTIIFGENRNLLDWPKRVEIIKGIARGLLYLHHDSRLRIIHRDLKAGNILLDEVMNPKITDFGTARLFGADQMEENTGRIIGTYGYMSPEYASGGNFSIKSDVFSFGVLLLEIISGKKNRMYYKHDPEINLMEEAWTLYNDCKSIMLLDESLTVSCSASEVVRFIQIGLLCVQDRAIDRPTMSDVLNMLSNDNAFIQEPMRPGFCINGNCIISPIGQVFVTKNEVTITKIEGR